MLLHLQLMRCTAGSFSAWPAVGWLLPYLLGCAAISWAAQLPAKVENATKCWDSTSCCPFPRLSSPKDMTSHNHALNRRRTSNRRSRISKAAVLPYFTRPVLR